MKAFQRQRGAGRPGGRRGYTLIGAILLLGGIGYAVDRWRGTAPWFLVGGLLLGIVVGMYELAKTVWRNEGGRVDGGRQPCGLAPWRVAGRAAPDARRRAAGDGGAAAAAAVSWVLTERTYRRGTGSG